MNKYYDLDIYYGDAVHDMWVDSNRFENTGSPDVSTNPTLTISSII